MTPKDYIDLKVDQMKLKATDSLSMAFGTLLAYILLISVALVVLTTFAFGVILLVGKLLDNYAVGAFIVCGVFLIALVILWLKRDKLFRNMFVKMFSREETYEGLQEEQQKVGLMASNAEQEIFDWGYIALRAINVARGFLNRRK